MRVLVACEFSGRVRDAFAAHGHDAWSCDLLPTEQPGQHFQCDVMRVLAFGWDLLIAHPECTYLANSGVRWLAGNEQRWKQLDDAAAFFRRLWTCDVPRVCIENPIPHKYAVDRIGETYTQVVQPWQFGDGFTKATCLWLRNLPPLKPTNIVGDRHPACHLEPPGPERKKNRSRTYPGIAGAMASQWGCLDVYGAVDAAKGAA